jgi:outer membrane lipopolysaccharide assembly protein LptE/RlpB
MMRRRIFLSVLLAVSTVLAGCGYALVGRGSNIPPEIKKVYLQPFENGTDRVQVDQILTRAVADELVTRQRFSIVASEAEADAMIDGKVTGFIVRPVSFDADRRATEFEIDITASVEMKQLHPEKILWQNSRYQFRDSYQLEASELGFIDRETPAIENTAQKFAETMVSDLLEGF